MICFLGKSRQKMSKISMGSGISLKDFILLRLWCRPFPAEILDQSYPSSRPHTAGHFSTGAELSATVQHMFVLFEQGFFNATLMTNSIMVSVHILQTCHHLMGYSVLCTVTAVVPYLPSSLASTSFSFHYCLYSFVLAFPSHGIFSRGAPGCGLSLGWSIPWVGAVGSCSHKPFQAQWGLWGT